MFASNLNNNMFAGQMSGLDLFFPVPTAAVAATATSSGGGFASGDTGRNEIDDDWGDFVDSSVAVSRAGSLPPDPNGFLADRNDTDSTVVAQLESAPSRIESSQAQWVKPQGPVPLSVFGEAEEEGERDGSGVSAPALRFSFDSTSSKHNNGNGSVKKVMYTNPSVGINDLIANLYMDNDQNKPENGLNFDTNSSAHFDTNTKNSQLNSLNFGGHLSDSGPAEIVIVRRSDLELKDTGLSQKGPNSVSMENLSWNPLNFDTQRFGPKSDAMHSNSSDVMFDSNGSNLGSVDQKDDIDEDEGWEFKTAESKSQTGDGDSKPVEQKTAESGPAVVSNTSNLSWNFWSLPTNGVGLNVDSGKIDAVNSVSDSGFGEDGSWNNDGWEYKVAETGELKNSITSKVEGNDKKDVKSAELAVAFENGVHQVDDLFAVSSQQSSQQCGGWGLGFDINPTSKTEATSFPNSSSQSQQYERNTVPSFFPSDSEETTWAFKQSSSENDIQNEEKLGVPDVLPANFQNHLSDGVVQEKEVQPEKPNGPLALSLFGEEDLESSDPVFHGAVPSSIHDSSSRDKPKAPGPSLSVSDLISSLYNRVEENTKGAENSKAATDFNLVNDEDDSWEFQGSMQPVTVSDLKEGDNSSRKFGGVSVGNETPSQTFDHAGTREQHKKQFTSIEVNDFRDLFDKLKTELCYVALNHLENIKEARKLVADSSEGTEVEKCDEEIQDMRKKLQEDVLISEIDLESLQLRPSDIREFVNTLKEIKFRVLDSEYRLSERLLPAENDWNSTIELLKHSTLTLKILNLCSSEQQSNYTSTWSAIASACAQELRHAVAIWKLAQEKNIQRKILSSPQGKKYILALGEVYRVAKILVASTRLYKPWILLAPGSNISALLNECASLWSSSGLEDALLNISKLHNDKSAAQLLESINHMDKVDAFTLHNRIFLASKSTCHISGFPAELIPVWFSSVYGWDLLVKASLLDDGRGIEKGDEDR
ncbi:PREDICTED: uncharacterized protein LOC104820894 isoform X3 [Tarenaya hassleriana]|uniref:uncharacterized protein LOC104820894 isoform X2 n=1 Tax=Tarenaya hassleriana TaxID=28532 RepID=UPI00053C4F7B|nr:PREDICTED: uncharacterized protein LOC104820894 isoform X2 [Tarenaya hassleriana]XP_019058950.1 PREDICTED: uncharacterized protein LOC104820894 isoform X3 [Tarenaya hassleriana]